MANVTRLAHLGIGGTPTYIRGKSATNISLGTVYAGGGDQDADVQMSKRVAVTQNPEFRFSTWHLTEALGVIGLDGVAGASNAFSVDVDGKGVVQVGSVHTEFTFANSVAFLEGFTGGFRQPVTANYRIIGYNAAGEALSVDVAAAAPAIARNYEKFALWKVEINGTEIDKLTQANLQTGIREVRGNASGQLGPHGAALTGRSPRFIITANTHEALADAMSGAGYETPLEVTSFTAYYRKYLAGGSGWEPLANAVHIKMSGAAGSANWTTIGGPGSGQLGIEVGLVQSSGADDLTINPASAIT